MEDFGRYAHAEYERRFLLEAVPEDAIDPRIIDDRFIAGTRLRLRTIRNPSDRSVLQRKLGHKVRADPTDARTVMHTNIYLDDAELAALKQLEAVDLVKTRFRWRHDGHLAGVDVYDGALAGLIVAELNFADRDALSRYRPSPPLGPEITDVEDLSGRASPASPQPTSTLESSTDASSEHATPSPMRALMRSPT